MVDHLRRLYDEISQQLSKKEEERIRFYLKKVSIQIRDLEDLRSPAEIFDRLTELGKISTKDLSLLKTILTNLGREDLVKLVKDFETRQPGFQHERQYHDPITKLTLLADLNFERMMMRQEVNRYLLDEAKQLYEDEKKEILQRNDSNKWNDLRALFAGHLATLLQITNSRLAFTIAFVSEEGMKAFKVKCEHGVVGRQLSDILITKRMRSLSEEAGYSVSIGVKIKEIDDGAGEEEAVEGTASMTASAPKKEIKPWTDQTLSPGQEMPLKPKPSIQASSAKSEEIECTTFPSPSPAKRQKIDQTLFSGPEITLRSESEEPASSSKSEEIEHITFPPQSPAERAQNDQTLFSGPEITLRPESEDPDIFAGYTSAKKTGIPAVAFDSWERYVLDNVPESQHDSLIEQSRLHSIMRELKADDFFFPSLVKYWCDSHELPPTLTEATEYTIDYYVQLYCKKNKLEIGNNRDVLQKRLYEFGKQAFDNYCKTSILQFGESHDSTFLFDLLLPGERHFLTKSHKFVHYPRQNIYLYALAVYLSKTENVQLIQQATTLEFCVESVPTALLFVAGIIKDKDEFVDILLAYIGKVYPANMDLLSLLGCCLIESKYPEKLIGTVQRNLSKPQNLDLSTKDFDSISRHFLEALKLLVEQTSLIEKLVLVSQSELSSLSDSFYDHLKLQMDDPNCDVEFQIKNMVELTIVARFIKFYELFIAQKSVRNRSQTTLHSITIKATEDMSYDESHRTGGILVRALAVCQTLKSFHLSGFKKTFVTIFLQNMMKENKPLTVTSIEFPNNQFDHSCVPVVLECIKFLPFLEQLDVRNNNLGCNGSVALLPLADNYKVKVLLENNGIEKSLDSLFEYKALSEQIGELKPYVSEIKTVDDIRKFQNVSEHVTQMKVSKLMPPPSDILFPTLALFTHLKELGFSECGITERSAKALADMFEYLLSLEYVNLSSNNIGDKGVKCVAMKLHLLKNLKYVDFSKTNISFCGMTDLHKTIKVHDHEKINVSHNLTGLLYVLPHIKHEAFPLDVNLQADRVSLDKLTFIKELNQAGRRIRVSKQWERREFDRFCQGLSVLSIVEYLDLSHGNVGEVGVESLSKAMESLHKLEKLSLSHNKIGDDAAGIICTELPKLVKLNHLDLSHNNIQTCGAESVGRATEKLMWFRHLNLSHNKIGSRGAEGLGRSLKNLNHLDLNNNNIGADGVKGLCIGLGKLTWFRHLDLSGNNIGDVGAEYLVSDTEIFTHMRHLRLSHNNISDVGAKILGKGIEIQSDLTRFDISHNNIQEDGAKKLMAGIEKQEKLKRLDLSYNSLKVNGSKSVMVAFKKKNQLRRLDLSCNDIGDDGAGIVSEGIEELQWLRHLALSHNKIGNVGADKVSRAVVKLTQFEHLDLSHNRIGDTTAKELCDVIKCMANVMKKGGSSKSDRVKKLDLSHNLITDSGADLLQSAIETLDIAPSVDLQHNKMHDGEKYFKTKSPCTSISDKPPAASVLVTPSRLKHWQKGFSLRETSLSDLGSSSSAYHSDMVSGDQVSHSDLVSASGGSDYSGSQASMSVYKDLTEESGTYQIDNTFTDYDSSDSSVEGR